MDELSLLFNEKIPIDRLVEEEPCMEKKNLLDGFSLVFEKQNEEISPLQNREYDGLSLLLTENNNPFDEISLFFEKHNEKKSPFDGLSQLL